MARNYLGPGKVLPLTAPSGGVVAGTAYLIGALLVVAQNTVAQALPFEGIPEGLFTLPKATGQTWSEGAKLYWDNTAKNLTTTASGNTLVGVAAAAAATGDTTGSVRLDGVTR
jgi:predicted RecA/RadA family phage recombinase